MASFFRRLFGGGGSQAPQSAPKPAPAPKPAQPTGESNAAAASGLARAGSSRPKGKTIYTSSLGLTPEQRSGINLKSLTGA